MSRRSNRKSRTSGQQPAFRRSTDAEITKAAVPGIGSGAQTYTAQQVAALMNAGAAPQTTGSFNPLPRLDPQVAFGPGIALIPAAIDPARRDTGRPEPRFTEYPASSNLPGVTDRLVPWKVLRDAASAGGIPRRCIQIRKDEITTLEWAITISKAAVAKAQADSPSSSRADVEADLRKRLGPEIARCSAFWERPDPGQDEDWTDWVGKLLEEHLVLDALAIYPRKSYVGALHSLEIVDGSTIKVLRDYRGGKPLPPQPAYQQMLWGFPRGEYIADVDVDGNILNGYAPDTLIYKRRNVRTETPYGFSAVEQCLEDLDVWLRRRAWIRAEFTDGTVPSGLLRNLGANTWTPQQVLEYETALNDAWSGQTLERHRMRILPPGFELESQPDVAERYRPEYDLFLLKQLASHFATTIAELNFTEAGGLGSSGYHEGQADIKDRNATMPTYRWIQGLITGISHRHLGMPRELEFRILGLEVEDEAAADTVADARVKGGRMTFNEDRDRLGLPRYAFAEADMPIVVTSRGVIFLEGASKQAPPGETVTPLEAPPNRDADRDGVPDSAENEADTVPPEGAQAPAVAKADKPATGSDAIREEVRRQLSEDYPPDAMGWLADAAWSGPVKVPLAQVDFSNENSWQASHEPAKVAKFVKKISAGKMKPVILVKTPGSAKHIIIDGHHRSLAYRKLGLPVRAYIGRVKTRTGAWDEMHESQRTSPDLGSTKALPRAAKADAAEHAAQEAAAFRRWARRNPSPARPFTAHSLTKADAPPDIAGDPRIVFANPGGGSPKAGERPRQWPGWDRDLTTAALWAPRIQRSMKGALDARALAERWLGGQLVKADETDGGDDGEDPADYWVGDDNTANTDQWAVTAALAFLHRSGATLVPALAFLRLVWLEGYAIGNASATALLDGREKVSAWGWAEGDADAAGSTLTPQQRARFDQWALASSTWAQSIGGNRLDAVAQVLADGRGNTAAQLTAAIDAILTDPNWAMSVAVTELTRGSSAGAYDVYLAAGVQYRAWATAGDERVCDPCLNNEAADPVVLGGTWPDGSDGPPGHTRCRCAAVPV